MIAIDGWTLPGFETKIAASVKLEGGDASGFGSFALSTDRGIKAGVLSVTTKIPFKDHQELEDLISKAKALDENGARMVYTVTSQVASAYKIRKAKFDGDIKAAEDDEVKAWNVSFNLLEVRSVSERQQQQIDSTAEQNTTTQATTGHEQIQAQFAEVDGP